MAHRTRARSLLLLGLLVLPSPGPALACPPAMIEEVATRADFIGRVVPISTIAAQGDEPWDRRFETRAHVTDRVRGSSGIVTLLSGSLLPERELLAFASDCGERCEREATYWVQVFVPLADAASGGRGGDWFDVTTGAGRFDLEALRADTVQGPVGGRQLVSWRSLTRMIAGAADFVSCREAAAVGTGIACGEFEGAERQACWKSDAIAFERRLASCER